MNFATYTTAHRNLSMDHVCDDHEPCIITRAKGKKQAVLVSQEDYDEIIRHCTAGSKEKP